MYEEEIAWFLKRFLIRKPISINIPEPVPPLIEVIT
jgi:hypothetical protein